MARNMVIVDDEMEVYIRKEFGEEVTPEFLNLIKIAVAIHEHVFQFGIPKSNFLKWVSKAWDEGAKQEKIHAMKMKGSVLNDQDIVMSIGASLSRDGRKEGYLSK
jgi:hypothetical protein